MNRKDSPRVFVPPPLIYAGLLALGLFIDSESGAFRGMQLVAISAGLIGLALIASALGMFRTSNTRPEPWQPATFLVAGGIYRFTRNPMYLGMTILSLAISIFFASLPAAMLAFVAAIIIDRTVIAREEAYLVRLFGEEYRVYRRSVRKWL